MSLSIDFDKVRPLFGGKLTQSQVDGIVAIVGSYDVEGDGNPRHLAYLLATAKWETAHTMQPIYERGAKAYFNKYEPGTKIGKALGNTQKGDGYLYRGRGYVQLTGRANYRKFGLENSPDKALEEDTAAFVLVNGCLVGMFTGKKLSDYTTFTNMRRVVNGTDKASEIASIADGFLKVISDTKPAPSFVAPETPKEAEMASSAFNTLFPKIEAVLKKPNVNVADKDTGQVAAEVTAKIAPILENANNQEPWYKSRIILGLLTWAIGFAAQKLNLTITSGTIEQGIDLAAQALQAIGALYALYGRTVAGNKAPLGGGS